MSNTVLQFTVTRNAQVAGRVGDLRSHAVFSSTCPMMQVAGKLPYVTAPFLANFFQIELFFKVHIKHTRSSEKFSKGLTFSLPESAMETF